MQIGDILNETYQVERPLGIGGQARVWQARHLRLPRRFAIKECPLGGADPRERRERRVLFERERDILAALSHPGHPAIPKISDFWEEPDQLFLVMDLVEGDTLIDLLARRGRLTMPEAIHLGIQICEVLTYLHSWTPPIIYRDLSPDNVMLDSTGQVHLIDFGIARTFKPGQPQNTSSLGKVGYASPEHLEGGKAQTDVRSDIYTVGALLYHLLTGQEPIPVVDRLKQRAGLQGGRSLVQPRSLNYHLIPAVESCILQAMELEPARRFQNAAEMRQTLESCAISLQQAAQALSLEPNQQRTRTRPVDPRTTWGLASAPTATPPSLPPHPQASRPWQPERPTVSNLPTPRDPTGGLHSTGSLSSPMSGNLGPSPLRPMTGPAGAAPRPAPSGPMPAQPGSPGQQTPSMLASGRSSPPTGTPSRITGGPANPGLRSPTGPGSRYPASQPPAQRSGAENVSTSRALVPVTAGRRPPLPAPRRSLLSRRRFLIGLGVVGVAAVGISATAVIFRRSRSPYTPLFTLSDDSLPVQCLAWSPDSRQLAGGGNNKLVKIWDMRSGSLSLTLRGHSDFVQGVAWSQDGFNIASASADMTVKIWDALQGGAPQLTLQGHTDTVYSVAWSPDATMVASASADKTVRVWDAQHGGTARQVLTGHTDAVYSVAWSPDGRLIASVSNDGTAKIWDPQRGGDPLHSLDNNTGFLRGVAWSPDSKWLATASQNKVVTVWNADTSYPPAFTLSGPSDVLTSVSWSQDGALLVAGCVDHTVSIWNAHQAGPVLTTLSGHSDMVTSVAWSPNNMLLAAASSDTTIIIWQRQS
jgi:serine/threonine protein kinase